MEISKTELPKKYRTEPDENGIITEVSYYYNPDDKMIKQTLYLKPKIIKRKVNKAVLERRKIEKFGKAKVTNTGVTIVGTEVFMKKVVDGEEVKEENEEIILDKSILNKKWEPSFQERAPPKPTNNNTFKANGFKSNSKTKNAFVPKFIQKDSTEKENKKNYDVKVSNLDEETLPEDFEDIIYNDLQLNPKRIKLVMKNSDQKNPCCKGYGFISFSNQTQQEEAIKLIDGHVYGYSVLGAIPCESRPKNNSSRRINNPNDRTNRFKRNNSYKSGFRSYRK